MNTKIYFIHFFHCMYVPNLLHICTKNCRPRRALVYKGFSKNAGLDEANQTKRIILPEPFVLKNSQRDFPHQKALISEEHVSLMRNCPFSTHFYRVNDFYFCPGKASEAPRIEKWELRIESCEWASVQKFIYAYNERSSFDEVKISLPDWS